MRKFLHNKNSKILIITLVILTVMSVFSHNGSNIFSGAVNTVTKGLSTLTAGAASSDKSKEELEKENINIRVVDVHTIKPIDREMIVKCAKETKKIITIEDHSIIGGLGTAISEVLSEVYPTKVIRMGMNDKFGKSGKAEQLLKYYKLDSQAIIEKVKE